MLKERERLRELTVISSSPSSSSSSSNKGGKTLGPYKPIDIAQLQQQRAARQQKFDEQRLKQNAVDDDKKNNNLAALEKLKSLWGTKSSASSAKPNTITKPNTTTSTSKFGSKVDNKTPSTSSKFTSTKASTVPSSSTPSGSIKSTLGSSFFSRKQSTAATASKMSAAALLQLKRDAKPLDPNRPTNVAINGSPSSTPGGQTPGRFYLVLVAHGSVVGPYRDEVHTSPRSTPPPSSSSSVSTLSTTSSSSKSQPVSVSTTPSQSSPGTIKRDSKSVTVFMASDIIVGKIVDRAVDLLRAPRTKPGEDGTSKRAALFLNNEMLPYNDKINKALGGIIKDGDRLSLKYI